MLSRYRFELTWENGMTDHKAALEWCNKYRAIQGDTTLGNLAAAYLELRELAKAVMEPWEPEWDTPSRKALRKALEEV